MGGSVGTSRRTSSRREQTITGAPGVGHTATAIGLVATLIATVAFVVAVGQGTPVSANPSAVYLDDVPSTTPTNPGDLDLTELEYACRAN